MDCHESFRSVSRYVVKGNIIKGTIAGAGGEGR